MGFLQGLGKVVGGIAGAVVGAPLGLLGIGGGAAVGSWLGGKVGQFAEGAIGKAKEVLGNPGGRRGALIGGLAGLALAPLTSHVTQCQWWGGACSHRFPSPVQFRSALLLALPGALALVATCPPGPAVTRNASWVESDV